MVLKGSKQMEITGLHTANQIYNYRYVQSGTMVGILRDHPPYIPIFEPVISIFWTASEVPGWQVICNTYCHAVTCHVLIQALNTDFFYSDTSLDAKLVQICGQFQNQPPIGWLKKYKTENKTLLYGTVTYVTALLLHIVAIHI
jgi:hypothetical protein